MYWSRLHIPTLKEAPGDAEVVSHKLLIRAGMIRKLTSGIYSWLPLGLRSLNKVAAIVREEMNRAGAQEIFMPTVQPADLWRESGRWEHYGKELLRFTDRHNRDYCLGPTHEEVVTDLLRGEVRSYRQLPMNVYQIQTKFRDEIRPRFGLMRGREFLMKDAYSFDRDNKGADASYKSMYEAYTRIFERLNLGFCAVEADSGSIGGSFSHEFMVLAETGEDLIAHCTCCKWAANVERAPVFLQGETPPKEAEAPLVNVSTPGKHSIEEVAEFMGVEAKKLVKTLIYMADGKPVAALVRGDRTLNEIKLKNLLGAVTVEMATAEEVVRLTKAPVGFAGPVGLDGIRIVADMELNLGTSWICGANKADTHLRHVSLHRDAPSASYADIRQITEEDACPRCGAPVALARGIEVGHVFKLGTKYSESMNATFLDENGKEQFMIMGCYGIGVSRVVAACIEQNHDADGIIFPPACTPFEALLINLDPQNEEMAALADTLKKAMEQAGSDVLVDDRQERPGIKFKDADLIGSPLQVILGNKGVARGVVECKNRRTGARVELQLADFASAYETWRAEVFAPWQVFA